MKSLGSTYHFGFYRFWVSRAIKSIQETPDLFSAGERNNRFKGMQAIGIGSIKVESLKTWLIAMEIIKQVDKTIHKLTEIGNIISKFDPTIETSGTWALMHYNLSRNLEIWNWYSNYIANLAFNQDLMLQELKSTFPEASEDSIKNGKASLVAALRQTPLGINFGYFVEIDSVIYKQEPPEELLSPLIFAYAVFDWMKQNNRTDIHSSELFEPGGPARIFNISSDRVDKYLSYLRDNYGKKVIWISRTAGLNSISINTEMDPLIPLIAYYQNEVEGEDPPEDLQTAINFYNAHCNKDENSFL